MFRRGGAQKEKKETEKKNGGGFRAALFPFPSRSAIPSRAESSRAGRRHTGPAVVVGSAADVQSRYSAEDQKRKINPEAARRRSWGRYRSGRA